MKKTILCLFLAFIVIFSGCITIKPKEEVKPVTFTETKDLLDNNFTADNTDSIAELKKLIDENPYVGEEDSFSFLYSGKNAKMDDQYVTFYFAVNRTDDTLKNISFTLNVKVGDEYLMKDLSVILPEDIVGEIAPNTAVPIALYLNDEQHDLMSLVTNDNFSMTMTDFTAETVE